MNILKKLYLDFRIFQKVVLTHQEVWFSNAVCLGKLVQNRNAIQRLGSDDIMSLGIKSSATEVLGPWFLVPGSSDQDLVPGFWYQNTDAGILDDLGTRILVRSPGSWYQDRKILLPRSQVQDSGPRTHNSEAFKFK